MFLIDDILLLPYKGLKGVLKKIHEMAESEITDTAVIRERLMEQQLRFALDEINEEEYSAREKELLERLNALRGAEEKEV